LRFFLDGVIVVARSATETTRRIVTLVETDRRRIVALGRAAGSASLLHELVTQQIVFTIPDAARRTGLSEVTMGKAASHLQRLGIVREATGRTRKRLYVYDGYLAVLQTDPERG
jgi:Fic family protein